MQTKNLLVVGGFVATLSLAIVVVGSLIPAFAASYAFRVEKDSCVMGDSKGNPISTSTAKVPQVQLDSKTGTITYKCTATVPNGTGNVLIFNFDNTDGVKCGSVSFDFITTEWQETISANGNAQLICHVTYQ